MRYGIADDLEMKPYTTFECDLVHHWKPQTSFQTKPRPTQRSESIFNTSHTFLFNSEQYAHLYHPGHDS